MGARMMLGAFSDLHGSLESLADLLRRAKREGVDLLVCAGDITNAEYAGLAEGQRQMREISELIRASGLEIAYVLGNRDSAGGCLVESPLSGDLGKGDLHREGWRFTAKAEGLDSGSIYVCHALGQEYKMEQLPAGLVLYGHDHHHRIYKNYIDLGYIQDGEAGTAGGGFFTIGLEGGGRKVRFHNLGGMVRSRCRIHRDQGEFYVPSSWGEQCPMCRNDAKYRLHF